MKSGKQRRAELDAKRQVRAAKTEVERKARRATVVAREVQVNVGELAPWKSYSEPQFVRRGYYVDEPFRCRDCCKDEIWTATQQKWWYEVAKGDVFTRARRCRTCRRIERERRNEARRVHLEGIQKKKKP